VGSLVAASFGLVYLLVNSGSMPAGAGWAVRLGGGAAFGIVLVAIVRAAGSTAPMDITRHGSGVFGRAYWLTVAAEVVSLAAGLWVLREVFGVPRAGVAWVSFVVGVHFFALARIFRQPFFHWLGAGITVSGLTGLLLVAADAGQPLVDVISGICPGVLLLVAGWWGARREPPSPSSPTGSTSEAADTHYRRRLP
jgi:hypothetical protein